VLNHYIRVDAGLLHPTVEYICGHWPSATVRKQLIFLSEIEDFVTSYSEIITPEIGKMIFGQLAKLVNVPNIEIAETALNLVSGESLSNLIFDQMEVAMRALLAPLWAAARKNWNPLVREDAEFCIRMFKQMDETLFAAQISSMRDRKKKKKAEKQIRTFRWGKVFEAAKARDKSITSINLGSLLM
jgi:hypothetical protein